MNVLTTDSVRDLVASPTARALVAVTVLILAGAAVTALMARRNPALRATLWLATLLGVALAPPIVWCMARHGAAWVRIPVAERPAAPPPRAENGQLASRGGPRVTGTPELGMPEAMLQESGAAPDLTAASAEGAGGEPTLAGPLRRVTPEVAATAVAAPVDHAAWAWGIWLAGVLAGVVRLVVGQARSRRLLRRARPLDGSAHDLPIARLAAAVGADAMPPVVISEDVGAPAVIGFRRPTVVVPHALLTKLSPDRWFEILVHEFAHVRRRDTAAGLLQRVIGVLYWPHPLVHLMNRALSAAREEACDNWVLASTSGARFAQTLLDCEEACGSPGTPAGALGIFPACHRLESRIRGLLDGGRVLSTRARRRPVAAFVAACLLLVGGVAGTILVAEDRGTGADDLTYVISGVVQDERGIAVVGADVVLLDREARDQVERARTVTGEGGAFRMDVSRRAIVAGREEPDPLAPLILVVAAAGHAVAFGALAEAPDRDDIEFRLQRDAGVIRGRILDLEGMPRADCAVRVLAIDEVAARAGDPRAFLRFGWAVTVLEPARTDGDGRFEMRGLGARRRVTLVVDAPGVQRRSFTVTTEAERAAAAGDKAAEGTMMQGFVAAGERYGPNFVHHAAPSGSIHGVVRDASSGDAIAGVRVEYTGGSHSEESSRTTTDAEGRYALDGVAASSGMRQLRFAPPEGSPWIGRGGYLDEDDDRSVDGLDVALERGVRLRGRVVNRATGEAVRARLEYSPLDGNRHADRSDLPGTDEDLGTYESFATDYDGSFDILVVPGKSCVLATALEDVWLTEDPARFDEWIDDYGHLSGARMRFDVRRSHAVAIFDVAEDATQHEIKIELRPGATQQVSVIDGHGNPLSDCLVAGLTPLHFGTRAVEAATFDVLAMKKGEWRQLIVRDPARRLGLSATIWAGRGAPHRMKLQPCGAIQARLVDLRQRPLAEWSVHVMMEKIGQYGTVDVHLQETVVADGDGWLAFDAVPDVVYRIFDQRCMVRSGETRDMGEVVVQIGGE